MRINPLAFTILALIVGVTVIFVFTDFTTIGASCGANC